MVSLLIAPNLASAQTSAGVNALTANSAQVTTQNKGVDANVNANASADISVSNKNQTQGSGNATNTANKAKAAATSTTAASVGVRASELKTLTVQEKEEFMSQLKARVELTSGQDLENFAKGILLKDENMQSADVNENEIKVEYKQPTKFLGVLKTTIKANVTVSNDAVVKVKYPWYRIFYYIPKEVLESSVEADLSESLGVSENITLAKQAERFETMGAVLKARHETALNAMSQVKTQE